MSTEQTQPFGETAFDEKPLESFAEHDETFAAPGAMHTALTQGAEPVEHHLGEEHIHLPGPSYWPILLALSLALAVSGLIIDISVSLVGVLLAFIFGIGWGAGWGLERHQEATE